MRPLEFRAEPFLFGEKPDPALARNVLNSAWSSDETDHVSATAQPLAVVPNPYQARFAFRSATAAEDRTIERGIEILNRIARR